MRQTLDSVKAQSVLPSLWIIVDDGSTDETPAILAEYARDTPWIRIVTRADRGSRSVGPGVIDAFYEGYAHANPDDFEFLCKLDLDLVLPPRYFETLIAKMRANPRLATASGKAYIRSAGRLVHEGHGDENSLGATKFFRVDRFKAIGGFVREVMWDGIDCHLCRMNGWSAASFDEPDLRFEHLRPMGSSQKNIFNGRMRHGAGQYFMGSGLTWMIATAIYRIPEKPYVIGGLFILLGWLKAWFKKAPRYEREGFREFLKAYQRRALMVGKRRAIEEIYQRTEVRQD